VIHRDVRATRTTLRRGFSVVELLIALMISSLLLTACLVALDRSFKSYEQTTESASTHVVSRLVMHRMLGMIRQGEEFGPYPLGVLHPTIIDSDYVEFVSFQDDDTGERQVTRLSKVADPSLPGMFVLNYQRQDFVNGTLQAQFNHPLVRNVRDVKFSLEYDIGPRLRQATIDMTIQPDDAGNDPTHINGGMNGDVLRLIASTTPRRLDE
jgi:prepilin-type N-terminal cleavage/methylation domain-containing protein